MKKSVAMFLIVIIFALFTSGCAQESSGPAAPAQAAAETTEVTEPEAPTETPDTTAPDALEETADDTEPDTSDDSEVAEPTERIVTDQLGRDVIIPETVSSVAVSHGPMLSTLVALGGGDLVVGTGSKPSGRTIYEEVAPNVLEAPQIGQQGDINLEELANILPDLFVLSVRHQEILPDLEMLGITGVAIDPEDFETIITSMRIVGSAIHNEEHVENIISLFEERLAWTRERISQAENNPTAIVVGRGTSEVVASGMIQAEIIEIAGAINLAADIEGSSHVDVGPEQILEWNPEYIIISAWGPLQPEDFFNDPMYEDVAAVINGNVFKFPSDADWWDTPSPATVLGTVWASNVFHPDLVTDEELDNAVEEFYYLLHGIPLGREYFRY